MTMPSSSSSSSSPSPSMRASLLALLDEYETVALDLFTSIERGGTDRQGRPLVASHLETLQALDRSFSQQLRVARLHRANQREINTAVERARERSFAATRTIRRLADMQSQLKTLLREADVEKTKADNAEKHPISYTDLLAYSQHLSRVTSAPPSFRLETDLPRAISGMKMEESRNENGDENPDEPKIPSMPTEVPFPDENDMCRGILFFPDGREPLRWTDAGAEEAGDAEMHDVEPQHARAPPVMHARPPDDEDAFDLDLN